MRNETVEEKLRNAVERHTPDVLDQIFEKCDARQGSFYAIQPRKQKRTWLRAMGALAAALLLVFGGLFASDWINSNKTAALIMLDVNPSIELSIGRNNRVLDVEAKNQEALIILDNMELKDVPIDVAVNALIGSMLKYGYIQENANSVLLSVEGTDSEKNAALQKDLTESIRKQLSVVDGAVLSQNLAGNETVRKLAAEYQISHGKAALVEKILAENAHLVFDDLVALSVNELVFLVGAKNIQSEGMEAYGSASDTAYIGEETAIQIALEHAVVDENVADRLRVELDFDDGFMVYEVSFYYDKRKYEYEINAQDGTVIEYDLENSDTDGSRGADGNEPQSQNRDDFIGEDRAIEIAETHAEISVYTDLNVELDKDDGLYIYEVEFKAANTEYDYDINAVTGEVVSWEAGD